VAGKELDTERDGAEAKFDGGVVENIRGDEVFDLGFLLGIDVLAEEFEIFGVNPGGNVAMGDNDRAFLGEDSVSGNVIKMVVGIDNEFDGEFGEHANFAEQGLSSGRVIEGVDDGDAVVADDEASVGTGFAPGVVDGGVDAVADGFESEGEGGVLRRRRSLRVERRDGAREEER